MQPPPRLVVRHCLLRAPRAQIRPRPPLAWVERPLYLRQRCGRRLLAHAGEHAARADRRQLALIADQHQLCGRTLDQGAQRLKSPGVGHPRLIEVHARALGDLDAPRLCPRQQRVDGHRPPEERWAVQPEPLGRRSGDRHADRLAAREQLGVAVAGATAERLGLDSPSLFGRTMTVDALLARAQTGSVQVTERTSVYLDEAGMADTKRLEALSALVEGAAAKLVLIGDQRQL